MRNSRIVRSCAPPRILTTEIACWTSPTILEVAQQHHRVGEIAGVDRRGHLPADQALLRRDQHRGDAALAQVAEQLVQLDDQEFSSGIECR